MTAFGLHAFRLASATDSQPQGRGGPADYARVCLAEPTLTSATLPGLPIDLSKPRRRTRGAKTLGPLPRPQRPGFHPLGLYASDAVERDAYPEAISAMYRAGGHAHDGPETAQAA
ncbi:hypothetical protein GCM10010095_10530 [Streptomyces anthocyanicus]|nr:hypothetical protein GCM10010095_10530 [Streptomyces anthocyanicus]